MRLDSIDLIRFGHFCGHRIDLPPRQPDYYLIYGDNEAGKSTLLRGISDLFFGVPPKTPDAHSCKNSELRIGGTISEGSASRPPTSPTGNLGLFGDSSGNRLSFRRRKGTTGTLLDWNDGQIADDALKPFLRELDRERFEQFFGLTHDRLREGGKELLLGKGDVGSALFQAAGLLDLRNLLQKLDADAKEIFTPKSYKKGINRIIEEYKQAKMEIRRLAISATTVREIQAAMQAAKATLDKVKAESHSLQQELVRLRRIEGNKPDFARLQEMRTALAALQDAPTLPPDARKQRDEAMAALDRANNQIHTLTRDIGERESRVQELPANALFSMHETEIEDLNTGTSAYIQSVNDRAKRLSEQEDAVERAQEAWKEMWVQPVSEAEKLRSVYSDKEEILKLAVEHKGLTTDLANAEEELRNVTQEQRRLEEELSQHPELSDPAGLLAAVEQAKSLGDTEQLSARLRSEVERLTNSAQRQMRKLARWPGTIQELESLKTPLLSTIEQYAREWESVTGARRDLAMRRANVLEAIRQKEHEMAGMTSQVAEASENELAAARLRRDEAWERMRGSKKAISGSQADAFKEYLRKADEIADLRFANATEVVIHDRLMKEVASAGADRQRLEKELEQLEVTERELQRRWKSEWSGLGSAPLSPSEMKEWMQARDAILVQYEQSREKEAGRQSLEEQAQSAMAQIMAKRRALDASTSPAEEPLQVLIRMAEAFAKQRERERRAREDVHKQLKPQAVEKRRSRLEQCKRRLAEWGEKWSPYVAALWLAPSSTPDQVTRALAVLEKVFEYLKDAERLQYRIKRIGDNVELFEARVNQLVAVLEASQPGAPHGPSSRVPAHAAVKQLHEQLLRLRNAETKRKTLQEQNEKDKAAVTVARENAQSATAILEKLKVLAHCMGGGEPQLDAVIAASERKLDLQEELKRISDSLRERNGSADLAQIEREASAYDLDFLRSDIATKAATLEAFPDEISEAGTRHGELKRELERLESSEEAALQGQKAEEALAQLRPAVAQYLRLRLAAEVLEQAIESYREKHQGPILTRASELFSRLTLGHHSGLTGDFGEDDKPVLVAIRRNGERVRVEGLSDGTRDQLYLALRLAAIEHHVRTVAPCPVILDDLLINSDDARSSAALNVIGELARCTQVLFFTHHKRLVELGAEAGAQLVELDSLTAVAVA